MKRIATILMVCMFGSSAMASDRANISGVWKYDSMKIEIADTERNSFVNLHYGESVIRLSRVKIKQSGQSISLVGASDNAGSCFYGYVMVFTAQKIDAITLVVDKCKLEKINTCNDGEIKKYECAGVWQK